MLGRSSMFISLALRKSTTSIGYIPVMFASTRAVGLVKSDFVDMKVNSQTYTVLPFSRATYAGDLSGYTDEPRGKFAGQQRSFIRYGVRQLNSHTSVMLLRGDARPLDFILQYGIIPLAPKGEVDLMCHRKGENMNSGGISFTSSLQIALCAGGRTSVEPRYGYSPTIGSNNFTVLVVKLDGAHYDVAGPSSSASLYDFERESTVAGQVRPENIVGYRNCVSLSIAEVTGLSIFTRVDLSREEQENITQLLSHHR